MDQNTLLLIFLPSTLCSHMYAIYPMMFCTQQSKLIGQL